MTAKGFAETLAALGADEKFEAAAKKFVCECGFETEKVRPMIEHLEVHEKKGEGNKMLRIVGR